MPQEVLTLRWQVTGEEHDRARLTLWGSEGCVDMVTCPIGELEVLTALERFDHYSYQPKQDTGELTTAEFVWLDLLNEADENEWQSLNDHDTLIQLAEWEANE